MKKDKKNLSIGVFDSGMGGISVLSQLTQIMPNEGYIYYGDSYNAPYGTKSVEEVTKLSEEACEFLISKGVKGIVVACNTATSASIKILRKKYDIPIIGMEPAVKPALQKSEGKKVVVLATPITLKERKFENLVNRLSANDRVIKVPAPKLVTIVENGNMEGTSVEEQIRDYLSNTNLQEVGAIVLGCTHFIFLKEAIRKVIGEDILMIDGNLGTARHLKNTLNKMSLLNVNKGGEVYVGDIDFYNSRNNSEMIELSKHLYNYLNKF